MIRGNIVAKNAIEENRLLYFPLFRGCGLYQYDKKKNMAYRLGSFSEQSDERDFRVCEQIIKVDHYIVCAPCYGDLNIEIYDTETCEMEHINLNQYAQSDFGSRIKFAGCAAYGKNVYIIGCAFPGIIKIDLTTKETILIDSYIVDYMQHDLAYYLCFGGCIGSKAVLFPQLQPSILFMDMETQEINRLSIKGGYSDFTHWIEGNEDDYYLLESNTSRFVRIDKVGNVLDEMMIEDLPDKEPNLPYFENIRREGEGFYIFPVFARHVYYYSFKTRQFEICQEFEDIMDHEFGNPENKYPRIHCFSTRDHYAYLVETYSCIWHEIDLRTRKRKTFYVKQALNGIMWSILQENDSNMLYEYLKVLAADEMIPL